MNAVALMLSIGLAAAPPAGKGGAAEPWAQEQAQAPIPPHPHDEPQPEEIRETQLWVAVIQTVGVVVGPIGAAVVMYWLNGIRLKRKEDRLLDTMEHDAGRGRGGPGGS